MTYGQAAYMAWGIQVMQGAPWDHKPHIRRTFNPRRAPGEQVWHAHGRIEYFYDVWSNIHYGYVGMACAFSEDALLDGAGLEQIGSDLARLQLPGRRFGSGMRHFDDPADQASIQMGIRLYRAKRQHVATQDLLQMVLASATITQRPVDGC
jgi:Bacterial toxin 44